MLGAPLKIHEPGRTIQLDWFHPRTFEVTIAGIVFPHRICQAVLTYSNWEYASVCQSESFLSLKTTLQDALWKLGGVADHLQTDNSSTATHTLGGRGRKRAFNDNYLALSGYYGLRVQTINIGEAHENGDVESSHRHLRSAIRDTPALRGSRDFESVAAYQHWLDELVDRRNAGRQSKLAEEKSLLRALPPCSLTNRQH